MHQIYGCLRHLKNIAGEYEKTILYRKFSSDEEAADIESFELKD